MEKLASKNNKHNHATNGNNRVKALFESISDNKFKFKTNNNNNNKSNKNKIDINLVESNSDIVESIFAKSEPIIVSSRPKLISYQQFNMNVDHSHNKLNKYHYHLKFDKIYDDKKLKLCGQCIMPTNLSNDLKQLQRFVKRTQSSDQIVLNNINVNKNTTITTLATKNVNKKNTSTNNSKEKKPLDSISLNSKNLQLAKKQIENENSDDMKIVFKVLDLTTERTTGLNLPIILLPAELFKFRQLKRLHLDCNQIKAIPDLLGENLINLEILTIGNNLLAELPDSFSNLSKLESLHLGGNKFVKFPEVLCELKGLKFLDLSNNELAEISENISNMKSLETLLLFNNQLKEIPNGIGKLTRLRTLWLGENKLTTLPDQITTLKFLDWEDIMFSSHLEGNPLTDPPYNICAQGLPAIRNYFKTKKSKA